ARPSGIRRDKPLARISPGRRQVPDGRARRLSAPAGELSGPRRYPKVPVIRVAGDGAAKSRTRGGNPRHRRANAPLASLAKVGDFDLPELVAAGGGYPPNPRSLANDGRTPMMDLKPQISNEPGSPLTGFS